MKYYKIILILCISFFINIIRINANTSDVYDVILFWGQSNMVGSSGNRVEKGELYRDLRVDNLGSNSFSELSQIDKEIIDNYTLYNHVNVPITSGTVYEYKYLKNNLVELNADTTIIGEKICARKQIDNSINYKECFSNSEPDTVLQESNGTNIMPYFAKTYYEKTGHKVIIVSAAKGGQQLATFLPSQRAEEEKLLDSKGNDIGYTENVYEALVKKYNSAIHYLNDNHYTIGNKFYVAFIGETDSYLSDIYPTIATPDRYVRIFNDIHNNLKNDLGLQFGAIVETSNTVGAAEVGGVNHIHEAQERLIRENIDIVLASSYPYRTFVPKCYGEECSSNDYKNRLLKSLLSVCDEKKNINEFTELPYFDNVESIHFNSAALSQIGKESATSVSQILSNDIVTFNSNTTSPNLFSSKTFTTNGLNITYDETNSTLLFNGTYNTSKGDLLILNKIQNPNLEANSTYELIINYLSGNVTGNGVSTFSGELRDVNENLLSDRYYVSTIFADTSDVSGETTINSTQASQGKVLYYNIWFGNNNTTFTFNNYKIKVQFKKKQQKIVTYGNLYGTLPTPERSGYTFWGWNGKNKVNIGLLLNDNLVYFNSRDDSYKITKHSNTERFSNTINLNIPAGTTVSFSWQVIEYTGINQNSLEICGRYIDDTEFYITKPQKITFNKDVKSIALCLDDSNSNNTYTIFKNFQVEIGDYATFYEPYYVTSQTTVSQVDDHTLTAVWTINTPNKPVITTTEPQTQIYGEGSNTIICETSTTYDGEITKHYSFGYLNTTDGTITNWSNFSTSNTLTIAPTAYTGERYYACRVYVSDDKDATIAVESDRLLITRNKKALTLKADDKSINYGNENISYTYTATGFVNNETSNILEGIANYQLKNGSTNITLNSETNPGIYTIELSGLTSPNYEITFSPGTLVINPKITFNANGGTGNMNAQYVPYNANTTLNDNTSIRREGYTFVGWNTLEDGSGTSYTNKGNIVLSDNITLYAMWTEGLQKVNGTKINKIVNNNNSLTIYFDNDIYATTYDIYRSNYKDKKYKKIATIDNNIYVDKGLTYGQTYYYKVITKNEISKSSYSNVVGKKVVPNKVNLKIKSAGSNNINLLWDKENITGYEVYSSINNKKWSKIKTITKNSTTTYNNTSLKANTKYYYKVKAYKTVGKTKVYGKYSDVVSTKTAPKKPGLKVTLRDYNAMNVTMESTKGASVYRLEKSLDGKKYELVEELPGAGVLAQEEQTLGVTYYFRVKACNSEKRCSGWVNASLKQTTKTPKVALSTTSKKVKLVLKSVNGANGYQIYSSTKKNGKYTLLKEFSSEEELLEFTQKTKKGKYYYYKVRSFKLNEEEKRVYSPWSGIKSIRSK